MEQFFLNYCEKLGQAAVSVFEIFEIYLCHLPFNAVTTVPQLLEQAIILGPIFSRGWIEAHCWIADSEKRKIFVPAKRLYNIHAFN